MKIGIDVRMLGHSGIGVYVERLIEGLSRLGKRHQYTLFAPPDQAGRLTGPGRTVRTVTAGIYSPAEQVFLPGAMRREECDLYHFPHYDMALRLGRPAVITVHDLIHVLFPQFMTSRPAALYARWLMGQAVRRARTVIADSENTRKDLVEQFGVPRDKIRVIWLGVDPLFRPQPRRKIDAFLSRTGLDQPYLLYVGQCRPHKNLARLVRAFALLLRKGPEPVRLVLRTARDPRYRDLHREIEVQDLGGSVVFLDGPMEREELPLLYAGARAFVFPSLYEGFGLPPLEAMACGTPVVASRAASLPEALGDAALLTDPEDVAGLAKAMRRAVWDERPRRDMIAQGLRQAGKFRWDETVRRTLAVYEEALTP